MNLCFVSDVDKLARIVYESVQERSDFAKIPRVQRPEVPKLNMKEENRKMSLVILDLQEEVKGLKEKLESEEENLR